MSGEKSGGTSQVAGRNSAGARGKHVKLKKARKFSHSSQQWLQRQLNDPYVVAAQKAGYRSRAAYKLLELDEKFRLLKPGQTIVDLGAAPGGWTQVAVKKTGVLEGKGGHVVGIDILPVEPIPGAILIQSDFTEDEALDLLAEKIGSRVVDVVLSDMAAGSVGHARTDHIRIMGLAELALDFALKNLKPNGAFVCKLFQGGGEKELMGLLKANFRTVKNAKPPASRAGSSETYVVGLGFKGRQKEN